MLDFELGDLALRGQGLVARVVGIQEGCLFWGTCITTPRRSSVPKKGTMILKILQRRCWSIHLGLGLRLCSLRLSWRYPSAVGTGIKGIIKRIIEALIDRETMHE